MNPDRKNWVLPAFGLWAFVFGFALGAVLL